MVPVDINLMSVCTRNRWPFRDG